MANSSSQQKWKSQSIFWRVSSANYIQLLYFLMETPHLSRNMNTLLVISLQVVLEGCWTGIEDLPDRNGKIR